MKKTLSSVLVATLVLSSSVSVASAASYAYSIGTDYDGGLFDSDIDTSIDATNASTDFSLAGYSSYYNTKPTYQYMRGDNPDTGTPRMESAVLYFSGHANYDNMAWNYQKKDGDYKTGVYWDKDFDSSSSGYKYAGIKSYDMTKVKLITFAGCLTAKGTDNITKRAADLGADATVGWPDSIGASSHTAWLGKYTDKLGTGGSVQQAVTYANSFTYTDSLVKNAKIYGSGSTTIKTSSSIAAIGLEKQGLEYSQGENVTVQEANVAKKIKEDEAKRKHKVKEQIAFDFANPNYDTLAAYLVANVDKSFDIHEYEITLNATNEGNGVIDLMEKISDFQTNSGYTVIVEDRQMTSLYNNKKSQKAVSQKSQKAVTQKQLEAAKTAAQQKLDTEYQVTNQSVKKYFDVELGKSYLIVFTEYRVGSTNLVGKAEYFHGIQ